jgi:hypothetical protein
MAIGLKEIGGFVMLLGFIAIMAGVMGIVLSQFQASDAITVNSTSYNITQNGLEGIDNATEYFDLGGTIIGLMFVLGIVVVGIGAFAFFNGGRL